MRLLEIGGRLAVPVARAERARVRLDQGKQDLVVRALLHRPMERQPPLLVGGRRGLGVRVEERAHHRRARVAARRHVERQPAPVVARARGAGVGDQQGFDDGELRGRLLGGGGDAPLHGGVQRHLPLRVGRAERGGVRLDERGHDGAERLRRAARLLAHQMERQQPRLRRRRRGGRRVRGDHRADDREVLLLREEREAARAEREPLVERQEAVAVRRARLGRVRAQPADEDGGDVRQRLLDRPRAPPPRHVEEQPLALGARRAEEARGEPRAEEGLVLDAAEHVGDAEVLRLPLLGREHAPRRRAPPRAHALDEPQVVGAEHAQAALEDVLRAGEVAAEDLGVGVVRGGGGRQRERLVVGSEQVLFPPLARRLLEARRALLVALVGRRRRRRASGGRRLGRRPKATAERRHERRRRRGEVAIIRRRGETAVEVAQPHVLDHLGARHPQQQRVVEVREREREAEQRARLRALVPSELLVLLGERAHRRAQRAPKLGPRDALAQRCRGRGRRQRALGGNDRRRSSAQLLLAQPDDQRHHLGVHQRERHRVALAVEDLVDRVAALAQRRRLVRAQPKHLAAGAVHAHGGVRGVREGWC